MYTVGTFKYYEDANTQLVSIPLQDGISVAFVVGDCNDIYKKINDSTYQNVHFSVPACYLNTAVNPALFLNYLSHSGVNIAFSSDGDFSVMSSDKRMRLDAIFQNNVININHNGITFNSSNSIIVGNPSLPSGALDFSIYTPYHFFVYTLDNNDNYNTLLLGNICE